MNLASKDQTYNSLFSVLGGCVKQKLILDAFPFHEKSKSVLFHPANATKYEIIHEEI